MNVEENLEKENEINTDDHIVMKELLEEEAKDRNFKERELDSIKNYENSKYKSSLKHCIKYPKFLNNSAECFTLKFEKNENLIAAGNYLKYLKY